MQAGIYELIILTQKRLMKKKSIEKVNSLVFKLIETGIANPKFNKVCDLFELGEDLAYFAIETIKDGEPVYIVGTEAYYTIYKKDLPQMQLPPLFYFLGKTFNPFRKI